MVLLDNYFKLEQQLVAQHGEKMALWVLRRGHYVAYGYRLDSNMQRHRFGIMEESHNLATEIPDLRRTTLKKYPGLRRAELTVAAFNSLREKLTDDGWTVHVLSLGELLKI